MTEAVAQDMIQSYFRRWRTLEDEKMNISSDLKELFAEAKGAGFDGKALRAAFRRVVEQETGAAEVAEHEAIVDLYVEALSPHARNAREAV